MTGEFGAYEPSNGLRCETPNVPVPYRMHPLEGVEFPMDTKKKKKKKKRKKEERKNPTRGRYRDVQLPL